MLENISKENFNQLLGRFSTTELENLIEKFPYFQQAHLLLAKKYQQESNIKFDQQLQLAALYTQDRELFYSIFNQETSAFIQPVLETQAEEFVARVVEQPVFEPVTEEKVVIATPVIVEPAEETEVIETVAEQEEENVAVVEITTVETTEHTVDELETVEETVPFDFSELHTFGEWLKAFSKKETVQPPTEASVTAPETEKQDEELEKLYLSNIPLNLHELVEEETHYSKGLDKFIEEQIEKKKHRPVVTETTDDKPPVTETMAKIYEQQKKYNKAIECYTKLGLLYPEKNNFFAARINYLKNLL